LINKQGFTFIGVLVFLVVIGIGLTEASRYWSTVIRREKEEELLFRGGQIKSAVESYYSDTPSGRKPTYPKSLEDLLKDPRYPDVRRHLRKIYIDPMTEDGMWGLIRDSKGKVKGVFSKSSLKPIKVGNFPDEYKDFEKAKKYSDWKFVHTKKTSKKPTS
jgi:type II secretory pathway pseudopilin PulG